MAGGSTQQPTQTTTTQISPEAQALFKMAYPNIATFAAAPPPQRYPGSTVAGFDPTQTQAQEAAIGAAGAQGGIATNAANLAAAIPGMLNWSGTTGNVREYTPANWSPTALPLSSNIFSDPGIWNRDYNVGLNAAIEAAQRPTWQALTEQALPAIRNQAVATGPFGGSRQSIAEGLATSRASQQAGDIASKITQDVYGANLAAVGQRYGQNIAAIMQKYGVDANTALQMAGQGLTARGQDISAGQAQYGQNLDVLSRILGLTPTLQAAQTTPAATLGAVGDVRQGMTQAQLNDAINAYYYSQYAPYLQARDILGLIPSVPGASTVSTANVPQANPWIQSLGGAATGASLGSMFGPVGTGVGAVGGAVLPFVF